jgi:hypothetical protein
MVSLFLPVLNPVDPLLGYNNNPIARRVSTLAGQDYFLLTNRFLCPLHRRLAGTFLKHFVARCLTDAVTNIAEIKRVTTSSLPQYHL